MVIAAAMAAMSTCVVLPPAGCSCPSIQHKNKLSPAPRFRCQRISSRSIWACHHKFCRCTLSKNGRACILYVNLGNGRREGHTRAVASDDNSLAAGPVYQRGLYAFYATYVAACFMERLWRFAVPLMLAFLHSSLLPVALTSFIGQLTIFSGGPWIGSFLDSMPRVPAFIILSCLQAISIVTSAGMLIHAFHMGPTMGSSSSVFLLQPWFLVLLLSCAVERVTGLATGVAFERDWVVQLVGPQRAVALANANAMLRRVDLFCEMAGPSIFGILLAKCDIFVCMKVVIIMMFVSLLLVIILVLWTNKLSNKVLNRTKFLDSHVTAVKNTNVMKHAWNAYLKQPTLPASLVYILLYFNAVLGPGGLMTSFLSQSGLNPSIITLFRGSCAMMGFLATFVSSKLIAKFGVLQAGAVALTFQATLLLSTVIILWSKPWGYQGSTYIFIILIAISRLGYWTYDIVNAQIFQTAIPAPQANLLGYMELSLASLAELCMMGIAVVASDFAYFGRLTALSMSAVAAAAIFYWKWMLKRLHDETQLASGVQFLKSDGT